jgi:hypothetical protein
LEILQVWQNSFIIYLESTNIRKKKQR